MAKMSRATKDTIQTIAVIVVVILLVLIYVVYPLNRSKALWARPDIETYKPTPLLTNDPAAFLAEGILIDTFRVEADGLTNLACVRLRSAATPAQKPKGLVLLIPREHESRATLVDTAKQLVGAGFEVITYDQRGTGLSTGKYIGDGSLEASDLGALIGYLEIHSELSHPLIAVGFGLGADAALLAEGDEQRIDRVIGIDPSITSERMFQADIQKAGVIWFPFSQSTLWTWYKLRSGYTVTLRTIENIAAVHCHTILAVSPACAGTAELRRLAEVSPRELLVVKPILGFDLIAEITKQP